MTEPASGSSLTAAVTPPESEGQSSFQLPFKTIFWTVVGFTAAFWLVYVGLAVRAPHGEQVKTAMETMKGAGLSGIGTIFGFAGGALTARSGNGQT